jgi:hypothetical protein
MIILGKLNTKEVSRSCSQQAIFILSTPPESEQSKTAAKRNAVKSGHNLDGGNEPFFCP